MLGPAGCMKARASRTAFGGLPRISRAYIGSLVAMTVCHMLSLSRALVGRAVQGFYCEPEIKKNRSSVVEKAAFRFEGACSSSASRGAFW